MSYVIKCIGCGQGMEDWIDATLKDGRRVRLCFQCFMVSPKVQLPLSVNKKEDGFPLPDKSGSIRPTIL